jgi:hypothetical protein
MKEVIHIATGVFRHCEPEEIERSVRHIAEAQAENLVDTGYSILSGRSRFILSPAKIKKVMMSEGFDITFFIKKYNHGIGVRYYCRFGKLSAHGYVFFTKAA